MVIIVSFEISWLLDKVPEISPVRVQPLLLSISILDAQKVGITNVSELVAVFPV